MTRAWLTLQGPEAPPGGARFDLKPGLTMLGGARGDVLVPASGSDCVHLWSEPPKLVFVGAGEPPRVNGQAAMEMALADGDRIEWRGLSAVFGFDDGQARLEEVPAAVAPVAPVAPGAPGAPGAARPAVPGAPWSPSVAAPAPSSVLAASGPGPSGPTGSAGGAAVAEGPWRHLKAGLIAEMSLGDPAAVRRWQEAVVRGEFDADAASRDLLASAAGLPDGDRRLAERSTRLMRDLLMSSVTKSPMRQVRKVARSGLAFLIVQLMILVLFTLLVLAGLLLVRTRFGHSIDAFLDGVVNFF